MDKSLEIKQVKEYVQQLSNVDAKAVELALYIWQVTREVVTDLYSYFTRFSLTQSRFDVLRMIYHHPDGYMIPAELAHAVGLTPASMTNNLDALARKGYIYRTPQTKDRRKISIRLTDKGREFMAETLPLHYRRIMQIVEYLSPAEQKTLQRLFDKAALGAKELLREDSAGQKPSREN